MTRERKIHLQATNPTDAFDARCGDKRSKSVTTNIRVVTCKRCLNQNAALQDFKSEPRYSVVLEGLGTATRIPLVRAIWDLSDPDARSLPDIARMVGIRGSTVLSGASLDQAKALRDQLIRAGAIAEVRPDKESL